jgi:hypothetical protein
MESVNTCSGAIVLIPLPVVVALQNGQLNFADVESIQDYRNINVGYEVHVDKWLPNDVRMLCLHVATPSFLPPPEGPVRVGRGRLPAQGEPPPFKAGRRSALRNVF